MATKYYTAHNAGRPIAGQKFEITEIVSGTAIGVYETDDEALQAELDKVVAAKRGVESITAEVYNSTVKKKASSFNNLPHSNQRGPKASIKSPVGVVVEEGGVHEEVDPTLESVEGALANVDKVEKPE